MILLIDNYDSFTYNVYQLIGAYTEAIEVYRNDKITVDEIRELSPKGIVISPGPGRPSDAGITCTLIRECKELCPILGICLGHQAIAEVFGASVVLSPGVVHGKAAQIFHNRQKLFTDLPLPFEAGRYHSLIVDKTSFPSQLQIDAESSLGEIMAISHRSLPIYGIQFHPESVLTQHGAKLVETFLKECGFAS